MRDLLTMLLLLLFASLATAAPLVQPERLDYDFGEVLQGEKVEYSFRFRNAGDEVLVIDSVHSSCGCTAALLSAQRLAPGDSGEIRTTFDSSNFRDAVSKTITMTSNDPQTPSVRFQLNGIVRQEITLQPARVAFGRLEPGAAVQQQVIIENSSAETISLKTPQTTNPQLQATLERDQLEPGGKTVLTVAAQVPQDAERLSGYVMVGTSYAKVPTLRLSVSASVSR